MVRFSRVCLAAMPMCHPSVIRSRQLMRYDGGHTLKYQDHCEGLRTSPLNSVECGKIHIPPDLVVDRWAADGESGSHHDFRFRHDVWTMLFHQIGEGIISIISIAWYFTTKSGGVWAPLPAHGCGR